jgi:hypothetical protein
VLQVGVAAGHAASLQQYEAEPVAPVEQSSAQAGVGVLHFAEAWQVTAPDPPPEITKFVEQTYVAVAPNVVAE